MKDLFATMGLPAAMPPRFHSGDPSTSRKSARNAYTSKAEGQRCLIRIALYNGGPMTAKAIAEFLNMDYHTVQRRISETEGVERTGAEIDGCKVWRIKE